MMESRDEENNVLGLETRETSSSVDSDGRHCCASNTVFIVVQQQQPQVISLKHSRHRLLCIGPSIIDAENQRLNGFVDRLT